MTGLPEHREQAALLDIATQAALRAKVYLLSAGLGERGTVAKSPHDVKLQADHAAEAVLLEFLRRESGLSILSEERGLVVGPHAGASELSWIVDPLDGSFNYGRGLPLAAVSVGLVRGAEPILGVVVDVFRDEVFTGGVGMGLRLNGQEVGERAAQGSAQTAAEAVLCSGLPAGGRFDSQSLSEMVGVFQRFRKVRYLGSAALSLAYVASGRADVYFEQGIRFWDVAAGLALVRAAGGSIAVSTGVAPGAGSDGNQLNVLATTAAMDRSDLARVIPSFASQLASSARAQSGLSAEAP